VPAQREVARDGERRLAHLAAVDDARWHPPVRLRELDPAAVLEVDVHPHRLAVPDVHRDLGRAAGADHDAGRQGAPPGLVPYVGQRGPHRLLRVRRDPQRREHRLDRLAGDDDVLTAPVPEVGGDAVCRRELGQLGRRDGGGREGPGGDRVLGHRARSLPHLRP
jgi:hypothetical protein